VKGKRRKVKVERRKKAKVEKAKGKS